MKTIGFIDYFLSEWHANNYPKWIGDISKERGEEYRVAYAWAELDKSPYDGVTTDEWCEKFNVQRCASIEEVAEKADYLIVLSPDNPEKHLAYAEKALRGGKVVYIDKTFAPDLATARKIFEIAEREGCKMFSTSALRFADELAPYQGAGGNVKSMVTTGGNSYAIYAIHQIEMLVSVMGTAPKRVRAVVAGANRVLEIDYRGRTAVLVQTDSPDTPFAAAVETEGGSAYLPIASAFFLNLIRQILQMFDSGEAPFKKEQTLAVIALREAGQKALAAPGKWVKVAGV